MTDRAPLVLPNYLALSDAELMSWSGEEFADRVIDRAQTFGVDLLSRTNYEITPKQGEAYHQAVVEFCKRHAWMEWWLGVSPPAKQIVLMEHNPEDMALRIRMAQQIIDEVKHQRVFTRWVSELGEDARLESYSPEDYAWELYWATYNFDSALDIAASLQCSGEPVLVLHLAGKLEPKDSVTGGLLPAELRQDMANEVILEEPRHISIGRDIIARDADTPAARRRVLEVQNLKLKAFYKSATSEYATLGAVRTAPAPVL